MLLDQWWYDHCLLNKKIIEQNNDWKRGWLWKEYSDFMVWESSNKTNSTNKKKENEND
jgi:hypothetical protein